MDPRLVPTSPEGQLDHVIEECAEVTKAIIKLKHFGPVPHEFDGVVYDNARHLRDETAELRHALDKIDSPWISLKERKPDREDGQYLVFVPSVPPFIFTGDQSFKRVAFWRNGKFYGLFNGGGWAEAVTHWAELPEEP